MTASPKDLQQIKGIGTILSQRLIAEGLDSFAKITAAGVDGLKRIKGINPHAIGSIVEQAAQLAAAAPVETGSRIAELKEGISGLRLQVQSLTATARDRFQDKLSGKKGGKLTRQLVQVLDSLEGIEQKLPKRLKRAGKGLGKAQQRLSGLAEASVAKLSKGLKKTRKALKRVLK